MINDKLHTVPHLLELNRVERLYTGGRLLDKWQGLGSRGDSTMSEEFIASTIEYIGPKKDVIDRGISRTRLGNGEFINLQDLINLDREAFLGIRYYKKCDNNQMGVLARVGDSSVRLILQVHPTGEGAVKYLGFPTGKTEAWYIVDTREDEGVRPCFYAGFKKHVTKTLWRELFDRQDVDGMLGCLHKIDISAGDVVLIESGMVHAMGPGSLFLEVHEACDYTIRVERNYSVRPITDEEMHYGIGFDAMFELFSYKTYTREEIVEKTVMKRRTDMESAGSILETLVDYKDTERFSMKLLTLDGEFLLPGFDGHYILIGTRGSTNLEFEGGALTVPQGRGVFVPASCRGIRALGKGELLIAYPFKV
ncbi:MAG: hypothetical protein JXB33_09375 [Clostridia bacterium]|nr:hypothetical protein [Clostridia bacterium]